MSIPRRRAVLSTLSCVAAYVATGAQWKAFASDKMTREQAKYQDYPQGIYSCAICSLFEPPKSCKVVEGDVSKDAWCKAFALAD